MANNSSRIVTGLGVPNTQSLTGTGTPLGFVSASVGAIYTNLTDGSLWTKTSGTNTTTGWVAGASAPTVVSISTSATASSWNQIILVDATSGSVVVTLPTAASNEGKLIEVKKIDSSVNAVIVDANAAETIDGQLTQTIALQYNNARFVSNGTNVVMESVSDGVVSENGSVVLTAQSTTSSSFIDSTNGVFNLPTAGVWLLRFDIATDGTGANAQSQFAITNSANTVILGSEKTRGGSITTAQILTGEIYVTTTGAATYKLRLRSGAASGTGSTVSILNATNNDSTISWRKISGYLPVAGQSVDYVYARRSTNQTSFAATDNVIWNQVISGNIPLNTTTGEFTLTAGKTYELEAALNTTGTGLQETTIIWTDAANTPLANVVGARVLATTYASNESSQPIAKAIFTPAVNTNVKVRVTLSANTAVLQSGNSYVVIKQLGSSAYNTLNTFTGATSLVNGTVGGVPFPIAGEQDEFLRGNGTWSKPVFSGARRFANAATSIPNTDVDTLVTTGTVDYTAGNDVTTATANTITIATTGYYRLTGVVRMATGANTTHYYASVRINGTTVAQAGNIGSVADTNASLVTVTKLLSSGDLVTLGARQASGASQNTNTGSTSTYLECEFLGI